MLLPHVAVAGTVTGVVPELRPPVAGAALAAFDVPAPFGPGHRGLDLAAGAGRAVASPVAGRVHFAGSVAGLRWVTVAPGPRVLVTVGPLRVVGVRTGDLVVAGSSVGTALGAHDGRPALHLSVRVDGAYVDPWPHLRRTPPRATLLPADVGTGPARDHGAPVPRSGPPAPAPPGAEPVPWGRLR